PKVVAGVGGQAPECRLPQLTLTTGLRSWVLPFWPVIFTVARLVDLQRSVEFCRRPLLPPARERTNFETGASGTPANVVRVREISEPFWWTESMKPTRLTWI